MVVVGGEIFIFVFPANPKLELGNFCACGSGCLCPANFNMASEEETVYCLCRKPYDENEFMIECDICKDWFHGR